MANKMRDAAKERFWRGVLKRFTASGLSVRAFCRRERLSEPLFYAWRRTLAERDSAASRAVPVKRRTAAKQPTFLPVFVNGSSPHQNGAITLELVGGRVLRLPEAIAAERLAELVEALEARATR